ncbi:putative glutamate--tRNA ligase, mitochondrial [Pseudolycoriella hygida]|uniref:Nondiscriminating glutamyl-tRNA synthetase EARS2, mitochondrial n=1 Tax=Pseudolycoriella hygida TaxID=35572 RepID=A0A9Q0RY04_9DIPT|nr:putative glutamate--tRNA ligase, mitochondrial [Pseudolycoriella hygida]
MFRLSTGFRNRFAVSQIKLSWRSCHTDESQPRPPPTVRVRFAPSPTGYLHLGGLRTALFNYLFAKSNNGKMILRIEDTDQSRLVEGATEQLCIDLKWAGIEIDEGPNIGGPFGPYIQSERLNIYRTEVKKLLENGTAYYCFCTERRLELLKKEQIRAREPTKYDNRCRHLTPVQIAEKLANKDTFCIRFKLDPHVDDYKDLIYGKMVYDVSAHEGDPVIIKSDGYPTYHFANVVDDHFMKITHVLRGVEWQISTTKHLLLYRAFKWVPPQYAHLPLLMNSDGSKLSKRQGNVNISHYRATGIRPQALINFITLSGGGFERKQGEKPRNYTMDELTKSFDITRINTNSGHLNPDALNECNRLDLIEQTNDPPSEAKLIEEVKDLVRKKYPENIKNLDLNDEHIRKILRWSLDRITNLNQLVDDELMFLWVLPVKTKHNLSKATVGKLVKTLTSVDNFDKQTLSSVLKEFSKEENMKPSELMPSIRMILSGAKEGPGVAEIMEILGKQNTLQRIEMKRK